MLCVSDISQITTHYVGINICGVWHGRSGAELFVGICKELGLLALFAILVCCQLFGVKSMAALPVMATLVT